MQDKKENFTGLVKTIKNKVHDWWVSYNRKLWTTRIFVYGGLLLLVIFVGAILFAKFNLFHTDTISARYMLSALVQSQAAIVAIVITLTLIAVQLTASAYSPRVIRIFMKNPDMRILLLFYGVSIFYGLLVLKMIRTGDLRQITFLNTPLEYHIVSAYVAGAFTFFMLFPYMWNIISLLKSENIIKRLSEGITKDKILKYIKLAKTSKGVETRTVDDPIQPIMDITHGSIMKYDLETTRVGLKAVTDRVIEIVETEIIDSDSVKEISGHFCHHLQRVGRLAASREDEESTVEVIENLETFGKSTAEKMLKDATSQAAESLKLVGIVGAMNGLEYAMEKAIQAIKSVGKTAEGNGFEVPISELTEHEIRNVYYSRKESEEILRRILRELEVPSAF